MQHFISGILLLTCLFGHSQVASEQYLDEGYEKYVAEDYRGAILDFNKAASYSPENAEIFYLRGICKSFLGQKKEAMVDLDSATALKPDYAEAFYEKGYIFLTDQNAKLAIEQFDITIALKQDFAEAYVSRGTARCMLEDREGANEDWKKAKELGIGYTEYMICE